MCELVMEYSQEDFDEAPELADENEITEIRMCGEYKNKFEKLESLSRELWEISDGIRVLTFDVYHGVEDRWVLEAEKSFDQVAELNEQASVVMVEYLQAKKEAESLRAECRG